MRALRRHRRLRAFDRYPARAWWRKVATARGLDPDRVEFLARMIDANPGTAWNTAVEHYLREQRWMKTMRRHSCPTCRALGAHSAGSAYLDWLETHVAWEDA